MNLPLHSPSSRLVVFGDAFLRARDGDIDPAGTRLFSDVELPAGNWTLEWSGSGTAALNRGTTTGRTWLIAEGDKKPLEVSWTGDVRGLRVWLPGCRNLLWFPPCIELLKYLKCAGGIRFLDPLRTNEGLRSRDARSQWVWSFGNVVALANKLGVGAHVPLYHNMTEAQLVEACATLSKLTGELTFSMSNEIWNARVSAAYKWLLDQPGTHVEAAAREIDRTAAIVLRELPRARHYVGGQLSADGWFSEQVMRLVKSRVDCFGAAAYMHPKGVPASGQAFAQGCIDDIPRLRPLVAKHRQIADAHGCDLEFYEGGIHPDGKGGPAVAAGMRHPLMAEATIKHAAMLAEEGVDVWHPYVLMGSNDTVDPAPFGYFDRIPSADVAPMGKSVALATLMRGER